MLVYADHIVPLLILRRKKLTPHWSSFIQPLRWRCKWVELQMKKLQSQAQLYDRQLEAYNEKKLNQLDDSMEGGTRSLPFSQKNVKIVVFKRRKRRRTESTTDITEYMSHHNLFSYYGKSVFLSVSNVYLYCCCQLITLCFMYCRR